ncbi:hypothetical protein FRB93_009736 [Tulasnella sp. JGI-2019a]|nr:hypothetical protein FRB93_009736 [Tulasnella sp. JGI-2019a]
MEDPHGQAVNEVIRPLLTGPIEEVRQVVTTYFTPTCAISHPLYQLAEAHDSRDTAVKIFTTRSEVFRSSGFSTQSVAHDESNNKLFCDSTRTVSLRFVPFAKAQIRSLIVIQLVTGGDDRSYIGRWEELLQPDDLSALLFLPGARLVMNGLRRLAALATSSASPSSLFAAKSSPVNTEPSI